jgi:hypothetical protein
LLVAYFIANRSKIKMIQTIAIPLIQRDIDKESFENLTLFQIGEHFSKKYNFPSLVEKIYKQDRLSRYIVIFVILIFAIVIPFNTTWVATFLMFVVYYCVCAIIDIGGF